jgi:hypothetical protein
MRLESKDAGFGLRLARASDDALQHRSMAAVHAIEVSDGQCQTAAFRHQGPVRDPHLRV